MSVLYLAQTDTTVGFLSQSRQCIVHAKQRNSKKPILITVSSYKKLKQHTRVPITFAPFIRRASRCSFIYPKGICIRVVQDHRHKNFLNRFNFLYSSSANITQENFSASFAQEKADVIVYENNVNFTQKQSSHIFRINTRCIKRVR